MFHSRSKWIYFLELLVREKSLTKKQVKKNTEIIAKFTVQLLLLIFVIGVIIYALP